MPSTKRTVSGKALLPKKSNSIVYYDTDDDDSNDDNNLEQPTGVPRQHQSKGNLKKARASINAEDNQEALMAQLKEANAKAEMLKARTAELEELGKVKDKELEDKNKALAAAVKNRTPSSAEVLLNSSNPRISKNQKVKYVTKNSIPREYLRIDMTGVDAMRKRASFQYKTGSTWIPAVMVDGEPLPVELKEHFEIMKEVLLYMKTEHFKLNKQIEEMVQFLSQDHGRIPGFRGVIFHPKFTLLVRENKDLCKVLLKVPDNLNTQMQGKSDTFIIMPPS